MHYIKLYPSYILILLLIILFSSPSLLSSQNNSISGTLKDSLNSEPLIYAVLSVQKSSDNSFISGEVSDADGKFRFINLQNENIILKIEYVGYYTKYIPLNPNDDKEINLGNIFLVPQSQILNSVTISGERQNVVSTIEKQVFRTDQLDVARGGTAIDALRNIPSISVNAEGELTMRGSKGFMILVNGKPTQIDASTILQQIPANTIDKIEMITAPNARFDADGKAGIINIVTKKGTTDGYALSSNLNYGLPRIKTYENLTEPQRYGADITYNYRKEKLDFTFSASYLKNDIAGQRIGEVNTTLNNVFTSLITEGERSHKRDNFGIRGNLSYKIDKNNEVSAGYYKGGRIQYRRADIVYDNSKTDLITKNVLSRSSYFNPNLVRKQGNFDVANIDFLHNFTNQSSIIISGLYEKAVIRGFTKNANLRLNNYSDTIQYTLNNGYNPLDAWRLKIDYEKPLGPGKVSIGYQYRKQVQKGSFDYQEKQGNLLPLLLNPEFTADIRVDNVIHGLYTQYAGKFDKLDFSAGLRYENAYRSFADNKGSPEKILKLSNLFPSVNVLYSFTEAIKGKLGFSRRVQRSTNNELNPYPEREHSETLEQGDPDILPEFINVAEAGMIYDFKKGSFYTTLYTQRITNIVNRVNSVYNDSILNRVYTNAGNAWLTGTEMGLTLALSPKFKTFVGGNIYNLSIKGSLFDDKVNVNTNGWIYSLNSNVNFKISETINSQFNISYLSARKTAQGEDSRFYLPSLSLKKSLLNNRMTITMQWQNMSFGSMGVNEQRITTFGSDFYTTTNYVQETNILLVNFSYNFNQTNKKTKLPSSEFGDREF